MLINQNLRVGKVAVLVLEDRFCRKLRLQDNFYDYHDLALAIDTAIVSVGHTIEGNNCSLEASWLLIASVGLLLSAATGGRHHLRPCCRWIPG